MPKARAICLVMLVMAAGACNDVTPRSPKAVADTVAPPSRFASFAGASPRRVFLSERESEEGARRELLPPDTVSVIATKGPLSPGEFRWDTEGVPEGPITVRVDLDRQLMSVFEGPHEIGTTVVAFGIPSKETPRGRLPILRKVADYHSRTYDAPMPASLFLRDDGVAIHGSNVVPGKATNGCIGVPVPFARKLYELAEVGDIVEIVGGEKSGYKTR